MSMFFSFFFLNPQSSNHLQLDERRQKSAEDCILQNILSCVDYVFVACCPLSN